jgi:hypothetical protein
MPSNAIIPVATTDSLAVIQSPTVETVHLTKDEQTRASKARESEKRLARKAVIANAEASATAFEDAFAKLRTINQQGATLYQSFKEIADATQANALKLADKLPKKTTTALEAIALDEAILILQGLIFNIQKSAFKEKKYFKQAVAFLKSHNAFQAPVGGAA